jgi:hypothetical protein
MSTNLTRPFIPTSYSWLLHITKICTSKYIVKNSRNNITIHFIIIQYHKKFTQKMNIEFIAEVYASMYYWKHESKLHHNPMFCWKQSKTTLKFVLYQNKVCGFLLQIPTLPPPPLLENFVFHLAFCCFLKL